MSRIDEGSFLKRADATLAELLDALEEGLGEHADVDLQDGILTVELADGRCYVINKHAPNRQIWMSSPVSGAVHFDCDPAARWIDTRGERELQVVLESELLAATGINLQLSSHGGDAS
jgi:frataxin